MPRATKAQKAKLARLQASKDKAAQSVYACGEPDDRFSDCLSKARECKPDVAESYARAREALCDFESELLSDCRAYRGLYGTLILY